jgi:hypothetical protein
VFQDRDLHSINQCGDGVLFNIVIEGVQRPLNDSGIQINGHPILEKENDKY